jgi:hypothetical protein
MRAEHCARRIARVYAGIFADMLQWIPLLQQKAVALAERAS